MTTFEIRDQPLYLCLCVGQCVRIERDVNLVIITYLYLVLQSVLSHHQTFGSQMTEDGVEESALFFPKSALRVDYSCS